MLKNCRLCGGSVTRLYPLKGIFSIYHCSACNTDLTYPIPTLKEVEDSTDSLYFEAYNDPSIRDFKVVDLNKALEQINHKKVQSYLDVGCAKGFLVDYLLSKGVDAYGIELFSEVAKLAQNSVGKDRIINGDFEMYDFRRKFDLVTMFDLIEHVRDPLKTLKKARNVLNTGGYILIITPDISSWKRKILKKFWTAYHLEHVNCFSCDSMKFIANESRLKLLRCTAFHKTVNLHYFIRQLAHKFPFLKDLRILTKIPQINFDFTINDDSMLVVFKYVEQ